MDSHQSTRPLIDGMESEEGCLISMVGANHAEFWSSAEISGKDTTASVYQIARPAVGEGYDIEKSLTKLLTTLVLPGWGAGLLIYAAYTLYIKRHVFDLDAWDTYCRVAQAMSTVSQILAVLLAVREVNQSVRVGALSELNSDVHSQVRRFGATRDWSRHLKLVTITTLVLWVGISGKHGLLQLLTLRGRSHYSEVSIRYRYLSEVDMGARSALSGTTLFSEYTRLLLSQGEYLDSPEDIYGNVKIPDLARVRGYTEEDEGWTHIPPNKTVYSSVLGVPVSDIPTTGNTTFTIEHSYYYVTCENVTQGRLQPFEIIEPRHAISHSPIYNGQFSETNTTFGLDTMGGLSVSAAGFQKNLWPDVWRELKISIPSDSPSTEQFDAQPLLMQSTLWGNSIRGVRERQNSSSWYRNLTVSAYCTIQTHYVSVNNTCTPAACAATSMRPSRIPHPNINRTDLSHVRAFYFFTSDFIMAGRGGGHELPNGDRIEALTLTDFFLQNPYFGSDLDVWGRVSPYYHRPLLTPEDFGSRIQMALNGFRMLRMGGTAMTNFPNIENTKITVGENVVEEA